MIILLSPSKTINYKPFEGQATNPEFIKQAEELVGAVRQLGPKLAETFGVSEKIAETNARQFKEWSVNGEGPAAWAYRGETFAGLSIEKLDDKQRRFAQDHLFIMSGLYGLLRPLDSISPYRLEMSTKLEGKWGKNLYDFWNSTLADHIVSRKPTFILNCASDEYFKSVKKYLPGELEIVTPKFLHEGRSKMAFAKYTRGLMAHWAIENQITKSNEVLNFDAEGYVYDSKSDPVSPIFNAPVDFSLKGRWVKT